jgi:transcriptional repressor NrdR
MRCPFCSANNDRVIDSRTSGDAFVIRRRRECIQCAKRFTTYEKVEEPTLHVIKKDGSRVPFDRSKIMNGLLKACEKRPVSVDRLEEVVNRIEAQLNESFDKEVSCRFVGQLVMNALKEIDEVAYVRFASVYREFKDVTDFVAEARPMIEGQKT